MTGTSNPAARLSRAAGRTVFGSDVAGYHTARSGYPDAVYRLIAARLPAFDDIGEIGPGTGLATEALATFAPKRFVAFEPDPVLAAHLGTRFVTLDVVDEDFCTADVTGGFDLIASASSFHWLDPEIALPKVRALLRPGGCLAIWWNVYRQVGIGAPSRKRPCRCWTGSTCHRPRRLTAIIPSITICTGGVWRLPGSSISNIMSLVVRASCRPIRHMRSMPAFRWCACFRRIGETRCSTLSPRWSSSSSMGQRQAYC